jgi:hypothetical protein
MFLLMWGGAFAFVGTKNAEACARDIENGVHGPNSGEFWLVRARGVRGMGYGLLAAGIVTMFLHFFGIDL